MLKRKKYFAGEDAHVFEIEGLDEKGQDVDLSYASIVKIPIEKDKKVKRVFFLPEGKEAVELAFEQTDSHVIFTAPHFTHYAFVYESAEKPRVESNGANDLVTISTKPEQQNTVLPKLLINRLLINKRLLNWKFKRKRLPLTVKSMKMLIC